MSTLSEWAEAFAIFAKHGGEADYAVEGHHDVVLVMCPDVPEKDTERLAELGWTPDDEPGAWRHHT
tara:strand:+ start:2847 stop:3044 length:198 start_codon:yes stop_codon:yes gene_type:complete